MQTKKYNIAVEATLEVIGGKWKCVILCHLTHGRKRTNELKRLMPQITQKMLTQQLRELEDDGVINRIIHNQVPPKVEYELSEYGMSLSGILDMLCAWGETHITKVYGDKFSVLEDSILNDKLKVSDEPITTDARQT
ncbi:helix-turn-helix domain-containing protein [Paenibacillus sp. MDMC362]|uniref:winged helix-turn-helix transcriptional regulator n=1 Tax=Paenibacillus sp. MDMC362 TaxID=2977365 RepID=UPI000DC389DA|nr:helix-turn-helix domain-containing protein [Paenibacillus sp. MDMC362]RAR41121.1 transcriptional regulator [Paenibacillus sp. MDMC362]